MLRTAKRNNQAHLKYSILTAVKIEYFKSIEQKDVKT